MNRPGDHVPSTPRQSQMTRTDLELAAVMERAIADQDMDTLVDAMAEKRDLERALDKSRTDAWYTWYLDNTGGAA